MATVTNKATTAGPGPATELTDEIFFCGTGAQVAQCVKIDGRPVGTGAIGPVATRIGDRYYALAHGDDAAHPEWRTAVYR